MAKSYEMLFKLGAQLGADFNGTFSSAQKLLAQTQREIQSLNKEQGSIRAFEKVSADVKKAQDSYNDYQAKLKNVRDEMANAETVTASMKNAEIDLERAVANANLKLGEKQAKLDALGNELREAGINTEDLAGESKRLFEEMESLKKAEEDAAEEAEDFGEKGESAFELIGEAIVSAGIIEGLKEIGEAYLECVEVSSQFQYQMSGVKAISGASAAEMELLSNKAKQMGADTKFTAAESGEALEYMAMAGWKTEDMLGGLEGIMYLAAAANEELGLTSDIVTDALTAFKLEANDAGHFADVLAIASSNSNTNVAMMGQTFKYAAPLAGTLGYSIEDVALAAGLMANSGIKAEQAGTALRSTFTRLADPPKEAAEAMESLGISLTYADGTVKPLRETIDELRDAFAGLSAAEQTEMASSIAGQYAMSGFLALINAAPADVEKLTAAVDNANGAAQRMADVRLDNLAGQTELFNSELDATKMIVGEAFAPEMEKLVKIATEVLGKINEFLTKHPEVTRAILAFIGTLGAVAAGYVAVKGAIAAVTVANKLLSLSMSATPWGLVLTGVAAVTAGVIALCTAEQEAVSVQSQMNNRVAKAEEEYRQASETFGKNSEEAKRLRSEYEMLKLETKELAEAEQYLEDNLQSQIESFNTAKKEYDTTLKAISEEEVASLALVDVLEELTGKTELTATEQERLGIVVDELNSRYKDLGITIDETTGKASVSVEQIRNAIRQDAEKKEFTEKQERYVELEKQLPGLEEAERKAFKVREAASNHYDDLYKRSKLYDEYTYLTETEFRNAHPEYNNMGWDELGSHLAVTPGEVESARKAAEEARRNLVAASEPYLEAVREMEEIDEYSAEYEEQHAEATDMLVERITNLSEVYTDAYDAAYKSIVGQYELWDTAAVVIPKDIDDISTAMDTQIAYWNDYYTDLANLTSRTDIEGLDTFVAKFADGSEDSVNMIAALAGATDTELQAIIDKSNELDEIQAKAASGVADLETGLTSGIVSEFESMIDGLDLDEESAAAAKSTVDAYIEQLLAGETRAEAAASGIRNAVQSALWTSRDPIRQHYLNGGYDGYADGTTNASPGWHLVGEEGPELINFGGGETVLDTHDTRQALGGTSVSISVPVTVYGNADEGTADNIGDRVVEKVLDVLRDMGIDSRRGAYA